MNPSDLHRTVLTVEQRRGERRWWGLWRRRQVPVPTWRGWLLIALVTAALVFGFAKTAHSFLAVSNGKPGGLLVVEGWADDEGVEQAAAEFRRHGYDRVVTTGGPIEAGAALALRPTYAELGEARLLRAGLTTNEVQAVPAPAVNKDRTYVAALTLKQWLGENGVGPMPVHLITEGTHARRSRLLYQKALGREWPVTVTATPASGYDPRRWWASSSGVKVVITELISYVYTLIFFSP